MGHEDVEYERECEPKPKPEPKIKKRLNLNDPIVRIGQMVDHLKYTYDLNVRFKLITELFQFFLSNQESIKNSYSESEYKRFASAIQEKCAEFAAHPDAQGNHGFQDLLKQVAAVYR